VWRVPRLPSGGALAGVELRAYDPAARTAAAAIAATTIAARLFTPPILSRMLTMTVA
jgi:hypothetical protein